MFQRQRHSPFLLKEREKEDHSHTFQSSSFPRMLCSIAPASLSWPGRQRASEHVPLRWPEHARSPAGRCTGRSGSAAEVTASLPEMWPCFHSWWAYIWAGTGGASHRFLPVGVELHSCVKWLCRFSKKVFSFSSGKLHKSWGCLCGGRGGERCSAMQHGCSVTRPVTVASLGLRAGFLSQQFSRAQRAHVIILGDGDPAALLPMLLPESLYLSWDVTFGFAKMKSVCGQLWGFSHWEVDSPFDSCPPRVLSPRRSHS